MKKISDNADVIFSDTSPLGHTVTLVTDDWEHIKDSHSIMKNNLSAIRETIKSPTVIYRSDEYDDRHVFFSYPKTTYSNDLVTKVIVAVDDVNKTGVVVTAFPRIDIKGGINENELLYIKPRL